MTLVGDLAAEVRGYLRRAGWQQDEPGIAGALWHRPSGGRDEAVPTLAVPFSVRTDTTEWRGLTERLAVHEQRTPAQIAFQIEHFYVDVARFRAANDLVIDESIPLTAGVDLVSSAYKLLRASATTARQPRGHIGGNFSKLGDKIVNEARLGQTERGSYIVPVLIPLTEPDEVDEQVYSLPELGVDRVAPEPPERRVTRTLAQALTAVSTRIVQPAREPTARDMGPLIAAGASREMVLAINQVLTDPAVSLLEASFAWATVAMAPASVPERVSLPAEASPLLLRASTLLNSNRRDPSERISGPIVEVRHVTADPFGSVVLQTVRRGRAVEVRVRLTAERLDPTYEWMRSARTIVVEGEVQRSPGRPLQVQRPTNIYPLDETYLPENQEQ